MAQHADSATVSADPPARPRLRVQFREAMRRRNYSRRTEQSYWFWIRWFIRSNGLRHPSELGATKGEAFLSRLATEREVAAATQNQALSALRLLYKEVLGQNLPWFTELVRAKRPVRDGKGGKDRVTMLPEQMVQPLQAHLGRVRMLHQRDLAAGHGEVALPHALSRKYSNAGRDWGWQLIFPSGVHSADPDSGVIRRHHVFPDTLGRAVKAAAARGAHREAGHRPHAAPLVRDTPARGRLRHPHGAGAARACGRLDDDDLHARTQQGRARRGESTRPVGARRRPTWDRLKRSRSASS